MTFRVYIFTIENNQIKNNIYLSFAIHSQCKIGEIRTGQGLLGRDGQQMAKLKTHLHNPKMKMQRSRL